MSKSFWDTQRTSRKGSVGIVRTLNGDILPSWMGFDFLANAGICFLARAQLPVAMGSLWHLMFEGCAVSLENYLSGGSS